MSTITEPLTIEPAQAADQAAVLALLERSSLPTDGLSDHFDSTVVAHAGDQIVGCAALEVYEAAALLRSVAVDERLRGQGWGQRLTEAVLDQARRLGVHEVYLLTETASGFFPRFGFQPISRAEVARAVQQSVEFTSACPSSALVMVLRLPA